MSDIVALKVRVGEEPEAFERVVKGRVAWTLNELLQAGERGCTPIDRPAPRWSDYVFKLRKQGFAVETLDEKHGGNYRGEHGRYVLRSRVEILKEVRR